jgi:hypothetical protein
LRQRKKASLAVLKAPARCWAFLCRRARRTSQENRQYQCCRPAPAVEMERTHRTSLCAVQSRHLLRSSLALRRIQRALKGRLLDFRAT